MQQLPNDPFSQKKCWWAWSNSFKGLVLPFSPLVWGSTMLTLLATIFFLICFGQVRPDCELKTRDILQFAFGAVIKVPYDVVHRLEMHFFLFFYFKWKLNSFNWLSKLVLKSSLQHHLHPALSLPLSTDEHNSDIGLFWQSHFFPHH